MDIHFRFSFAQHHARASRVQWVFLLSSLVDYRVWPFVFHHAIEVVVTTTRVGGVIDGASTQPQKKSATHPRGDGQQVGGRCRHAEFLPISSEYCTARHGVRSQDYALALHAPSLGSHSRIPLPYCPFIVPYRLRSCTGIAHCIVRACAGHASPTANSRRQLPSREPSPFPFQMRFSTTFLHSDICLPNSTSTVSAIDIFHSSAIPGYVCFSPGVVS
jgi:hypothetical protein